MSNLAVNNNPVSRNNPVLAQQAQIGTLVRDGKTYDVFVHFVDERGQVQQMRPEVKTTFTRTHNLFNSKINAIVEGHTTVSPLLKNRAIVQIDAKGVLFESEQADNPMRQSHSALPETARVAETLMQELTDIFTGNSPARVDSDSSDSDSDSDDDMMPAPPRPSSAPSAPLSDQDNIAAPGHSTIASGPFCSIPDDEDLNSAEGDDFSSLLGDDLLSNEDAYSAAAKNNSKFPLLSDRLDEEEGFWGDKYFSDNMVENRSNGTSSSVDLGPGKPGPGFSNAPSTPVTRANQADAPATPAPTPSFAKSVSANATQPAQNVSVTPIIQLVERKMPAAFSPMKSSGERLQDLQMIATAIHMRNGAFLTPEQLSLAYTLLGGSNGKFAVADDKTALNTILTQIQMEVAKATTWNLLSNPGSASRNHRASEKAREQEAVRDAGKQLETKRLEIQRELMNLHRVKYALDHKDPAGLTERQKALYHNHYEFPGMTMGSKSIDRAIQAARQELSTIG